jgi:RNA polymerase sigma factor (sigma-70 family)
MASGQLSQVLGHLRRIIGPRTVPDQTDVALLHRFLTLHEEAAFEALLLRYGPLVLGLCRRVLGDIHDAEDAFQATFLVLARKAGSIRKGNSLGSWLYGVASRVARKARQSAARRRTGSLPASGLDALPDQKSPSPDPSAQAIGREMQAIMDQEIQRLPSLSRECLVRCYLEGQTNEQVACALGYPAGSMSRHLARARDLLRERLVRRGLVLPASLFATALTDSLSVAAVPATLATATARAALAFAINSRGLAGAASPQAAGLAQSIVRAMFMTKLKIATILLVTAGVLAVGVGRLWYPSAIAQGPTDKGQSAKNTPAQSDPAKMKDPSVGSRSKVADLRKKLQQPITLEKGIDPNTPLLDALDFFSDHYGVPIIVETQAFKQEAALAGEEESGDVRAVPVALQRMTNVALGSALRLLLLQVPSASGATYVVRPEGVIITTQRIARPEDWIGEYRRGVPVVNAVLDKTPLREALQDLADQSGISVLVDGRAADKAKTEVAATLSNVPLDTAVRLLADMAELKAVAIDNVMYVTTPNNAKTLEAEQKQRREQGRRRQEKKADEPQKEPAKGPSRNGKKR